MALVSVSQAAQLTGKNRTTIIRAIDKGHLSASRHEFGQYLIDPAELERVYGTLRTFPVRDDAEQRDAPAEHALALAREVELLREMLEQERAAHERTRSDHERERRTWQDDRQLWEGERTFLRDLVTRHTEQIKLLTDQREQERHSPSLSLWARLFHKNA